MPENEVYMQKISETLATVAAKVQQDSSANLVSTNVLAENFYREFLNVLCGWELDSANTRGNMPGIDLVSEKDRIAVQVSVTDSKEKLQRSLDRLDAGACAGYRFLFLLIAPRRTLRTGLRVPEGVCFDPADVWSNAELLRMAQGLPLDRLKQLYALCCAYTPGGTLPKKTGGSAAGRGALRFAGIPVAFHPIISSFQKGENEFAVGDITVVPSDRQYQIPADIRALFEHRIDPAERAKIDANTYEPKVRIEKVEIDIYGRGPRHDEIILTFSKSYYRDFLIEMKLLDQRLPNGKKVREQYMARDQLKPERSQLPCQCGVGLFLLTGDNCLLYSQASPNVTVNPNQLNYVSSGSMDWDGPQTNPFRDVIRECREELDYQLSEEHPCLYSFGLDLGRGFYQFSFWARSPLSSQEIIANAMTGDDFTSEIADIKAVPFDLTHVSELLREPNWDETAKANLIILAAKEFGRDAMEKALDPVWFRKKSRRDLLAECNRRANLDGPLAVLSAQYPRHRLQKMLDDYVSHALAFIDDDLDFKSVFEVGCGIGALTRPLAAQAREFTAVDVSPVMLERTRSALGPELAERIELREGFVQDLPAERRYDVLICSNVLIHNHDELNEIARKLAELSDVIYLFERVNDGTQPAKQSGGFTQPLREEAYTALFPDYRVCRRGEYVLFRNPDGTPVHTILFLKLTRK